MLTEYEIETLNKMIQLLESNLKVFREKDNRVTPLFCSVISGFSNNRSYTSYQPIRAYLRELMRDYTDFHLLSNRIADEKINEFLRTHYTNVNSFFSKVDTYCPTLKKISYFELITNIIIYDGGYKLKDNYQEEIDNIMSAKEGKKDEQAINI